MDNKALGIKILKSTALFTGKAAWFLLCKVCLAVLLIMGFIVEKITSRKDEATASPLGDPYDADDLDDPENPSSPFFFPSSK